MKNTIDAIRNQPFVLALLIIGFAVGLWASVSPPSDPSENSDDLSVSQLNEQNQKGAYLVTPYDGASLTGHYLASRFAESANDMDVAAENMLAAMRQQEDSDVSLQRTALRIFVSAGRMEEAADVAEKIQASGTNDSLALILTIAHYTKQGEFAKAQELLAKPAANHGMYEIIRPILAKWVELGSTPYAGGPVTLGEMPKNAGFLASFMHYQLALMNDMVGQKEAAEEHYRKAINDPQALPYRLVQAMSNFYLRQGNKAKAQEIFDQYSTQNPASELLPDGLPQGDKEAIAVVPLVETPTQGIAEILFTTASLLFGEEVEREAMVYLRLTLYLRPDLPPAQLMLASLMEQMEDYDEAINTYAAIDKETIFYKRGQVRTALNYLAKDEKDKAISLLKDLIGQYPNESEPMVALGDIYRSDKQFKQAAEIYNRALEKVKTERADLWSLYYARGIAYERSGQWPKAEADFKKALALQPDQPDVLNYLGYSWLMQGQNLTQARDFIEQALQQRPVDSHIIDSMGWAFYLQGEYKQAVELLEQAAEITPQDPTINEHLGDAYWRVGREIEARFQWSRALQFEPENPEALQHKVASGLPAEPSDKREAEPKAKTPVVSAVDHSDAPIKAE